MSKRQVRRPEGVHHANDGTDPVMVDSSASIAPVPITVPVEILVPIAVRTSSAAGAGLFKAWEIAQSTAGGAVLITDATEIHIDYQKAVSEGLMPTYFVQLLAYQIAWHLAEIITDQTQKSEYWRSVALGTAAEGFRGGYFRQAANIDAGGQTPSVVGDYLLTDVR